MYNMDISLLGYKFNLEVLILIGVVYLILVGDLLCPWSSLIECNVLLKSAAEAGADLGIT